MAITAETRTGIITLSVAMLGSAPGTDQLAEWIEAVSEGMSLDDLANHIAASSEFRAVYGLTTNEEFASLFLSNVFDGEVSADIQTLAEGLVVAMLNDGMSRGSLAFALASALHDMSDMDHPAYGDFGMAAANLANKAEVAEYYALEAKMEDPSGAVLEGVTSDMATVARAKHDIDSPPADAMFHDVGELSIMENAPSGMVGSVTASDPNSTSDHPDPVTYSLKDAPDGFMIDAASGAISYAGEGLDYEAGATVDLTVVATSVGADGMPKGVEEMVTMMVGDVDENAAMFNEPDGGFDLSLEEHATSGSVGSVTAADADGDDVMYSLGEGAAEGFSINSDGEISYSGEGIDYEDTQSVDLTVVASSYGEDGRMMQEVSQEVTVQITNLHDAEFDSDDDLALAEGASGSEKAVVIGTVSASDADEGDTVSYRLSGPAVDSDNDGILHTGFEIDAATGEITYTGAGISSSVSKSVDLTVLATSRGDNGQDKEISKTVTISIKSGVGAVFDALGEFSIDENAMMGEVGTVNATDADGDEVTYSLGEGAPEGFSINAEGVISYAGDGLDYEEGQSVGLTVVATSAGAQGAATPVESDEITVNINNLNDNAPMVGEAMGENSLHASTPEADMPTGLSFSVTDADGDVGEYSAVVYEGEGEDMAVSTRFEAVADESDSMSFNIVAIGGAALAAGEVSLTVKASDGMHDSEAQMVNFTIGEAPAPVPVPGDVFNLTRSRDDYQGTDGNDTFISDPDANGLPTLSSFDSINGGDGWDTLQIFDIEPSEEIGEGGAREGGLEIDSSVDAFVENVEEVYIHARGIIDVDLTEWEGLEKLELGRFGRQDGVDVTVDGASVETTRTFGGNVTVVGAGGELSLEASSGSTVKVGSGEHTTSVMVKGGKMVDINANGAGGQSMTVTSVVIDGAEVEGLGNDKVRGTTGTLPVDVTIRAGNANDEPSAEVTVYGTWADDTFTPVAPPTGDTKYYKAKVQPSTSLREGEVVVVTDEKMAATKPDPDSADSGDVPVHVNSDAIESITLHNTSATVAVINKSKEAEDLMVTVNKYGTAAIGGKLCLTDGSDGHKGSPSNIGIEVVGNSNFILAGNATKTVDVTLGADLELGVTTFANPNPSTPSGTLESVMLSGAGKFTMDAMGLSKLASIDASGASGGVAIKNVGDSVTSYMGSSGSDRLHVSEYNSKDGVMIDLGAGDDVFTSGTGNDKSRVDGGDGMDTLHLTGGDTTYKPKDGDAMSIYSNFEKLDVGGGSGNYDVALLGVDSVMVSESTTGTGGVTLSKMADGMGITVTGKGGKMNTDATIVHNMMDSTAGNRHSGALDVTLTATGHKDDTKTMGTGVAHLTLTTDEEIELLNIDSGAVVAGKASAAVYRNVFTLMGMETDNVAVDSEVEVINVTGNAALTVSIALSENGSGSQFEELEEIDASGNSGGVTFDASATSDLDLNQGLKMMGGSGMDNFTGGGGVDKLTGNGGVDTLTGGAGDDVLRGGAGGDMLDGGDGADDYIIASVSESQLSFNAKTGAVEGVDIIDSDGWTSGSDDVLIAKSVFDSFTGVIKAYGGTNVPDSWVISNIDGGGDTDPSANSLSDFVKANANGFFETITPTPDKGFGGTVNHHSVAVIRSTIDPDGDDGNADNELMTWVFIDADGDGDFDAANDIVIGFTGSTVDIETGDFGAMS